MDIPTLMYVLIVMVILPTMGFFARKILQRLDNMEKELQSFITHQEARTLVEDLQAPLKVSMQNVEYLLNRILNELEQK